MTDYSSYWTTNVSKVTDASVLIRGYSLDEIIGSLPFPACAYLLVRGEMPTPGQSKMMDAVFTCILDYSLYKPGTVAARFTASANPQMVPALATSVLAVGRHTLAPDDTARFLAEASTRHQESGLPLDEFATGLIEEFRSTKRRVPGFGHPVFRYEDPRAQKLKNLAVEGGVWGPLGELYEAVHRAFTQVPGKETIPINDVGMMAVILTEMGFTPEEMTGLAIISMMPGVIAHVSEELREGKPIRIVPDDIATYPEQTQLSLETDMKDKGWPSAV